MATISNNEIKIKYTLDTTDLANATALFDRLSAEDRQLLNDLRRLQAQFNATGQAGQQAGNQMAGAAANANRQFSGLQNQIKSAFAVGAIISFTKSVIDATVKMQGLQKAIEFTAGSLAGGAANFAFIEKLAEKLGLPLQAAAEGFKTFSAAANRAGYTIMQQRQMFTDLSKAMAALQLDSQSAQLVFFGFGQLMSKNKVSAQELYHQIGERLPIAMEAAQIAAAKITGQLKVTSGELIKLVEDGKLLSTEFAPEFTKALGELSKSAAYVETLGKDVNLSLIHI
jgi:tape measure domain-containing protein